MGTGALLAALLVAACGGGGSSTSAGPSSTLPSKAAFISSADAICGPVTSELKALPALGSSATASQITEFVQKTEAIVEPAVNRLNALPGSVQERSVLNDNLIAPTEKQDAAAHAFLDQLSAAGNDTSKQQAALQTFEAAATDPQQQAHDAALASYGFNACSKTNQ